MSAHTPGPWRVGKTCVGICAVFDHTGSGKAVATFGTWNHGREAVNFVNCESDARLIAAAPMGYDLAKSVLAWWEQHQHDTQPCGDGDSQNTYDDKPEFVELAKQFIAKAEGKS